MDLPIASSPTEQTHNTPQSGSAAQKALFCGGSAFLLGKGSRSFADKTYAAHRKSVPTRKTSVSFIIPRICEHINPFARKSNAGCTLWSTHSDSIYAIQHRCSTATDLGCAVREQRVSPPFRPDHRNDKRLPCTLAKKPFCYTITALRPFRGYSSVRSCCS